MEILSTTIDRPEGIRLFVFGSYLISATPGDIDLLAVYDPKLVPHHEIYARLESAICRLRTFVGLDVDLTVLSVREATDSLFVQEEGAVEVFARPTDVLALDQRAQRRA